MFEQHKKINQNASKCDDQKNLNDILDDVIVLTLEWVTYNSPNLPMTSTLVKNPSASKSLCLFTNIFDVKEKITKLCVGAENPNAEPWKFLIACVPRKKN